MDPAWIMNKVAQTFEASQRRTAPHSSHRRENCEMDEHKPVASIVVAVNHLASDVRIFPRLNGIE